MGKIINELRQRASYDWTDLPTEVIQHRDLLRNAGGCHGLGHGLMDGWHFDDTDWQQYEVLDVQSE